MKTKKDNSNNNNNNNNNNINNNSNKNTNRECWHIAYSLFLSPSPFKNQTYTLQKLKHNNINITIHKHN